MSQDITLPGNDVFDTSIQLELNKILVNAPLSPESQGVDINYVFNRQVY